MEVASHKYKFHSLQEFLIQIHRELIRITKTQCIQIKFDIENDYIQKDYIDKLLEYLVKELKKYDMYSKFEAMSQEHRRKELLILLTKELGVKIHQNEAGDIGGQSNTFSFNSSLPNCCSKGDIGFKLNEDRITPCVRDSALTVLYETNKPHNVYVQYQLYSTILDKIQQELCGICENKDPVIDVLLTGLCVRLKKQGDISKLAYNSTEESRREMLRLLAAKLMEKCNKITLLDMIRDTSTGANDTLCKNYKNNYYCPNEIWEKIINMGPKQDMMDSLYNNYPIFIIELFLEYLSEAKEYIILEQEKIFDAKISLLKKEALETVDSLKKHLQSKIYVESFLNDYTQQLQVHYDITENEFYRQQLLKSKIKHITTKIRKNQILANMNLKRIYSDIKKHRQIVHNLHDTLRNVEKRITFY